VGVPRRRRDGRARIARGADVAAREELDNLTWVVNCNLQQLDGPVRGNGKIIQELEGIFRGAGWNVIKVVWGREWDDLLARDVDGVLVSRMNEVPTGSSRPTRSSRAGTSASTSSTPTRGCASWSSTVRRADREAAARRARLPQGLRGLQGGHEHAGQPTVILAQTIKGWTLGPDFEARNATHQMKKLTVKATLKTFRDRLQLDIPDEELEGTCRPTSTPARTARRSSTCRAPPPARRVVPQRRVQFTAPTLPEPDAYDELKQGSGNQEVATTMAFVRLLKDLMKVKGLGERIVPIIPDEARTFGMDSLFPSLKIYDPHGQTYEPVDQDLLLSYKQATDGQILHEGITEAGSMGSFHAAGSAYATHGEPMIPVYIFYSMFGFQRTADSIWSAADQRAAGS
jgi:pyruvate dehydrogenase E1 component